MNVFNDSTEFLSALMASEPGFDVRDLVCSAIEASAVHAKSRELRLKRSVHSLLPHHLHGDSATLGRILTDLVANAVEQTPRGEICLSAAIDDESPVEMTVRFTVSSPFGRINARTLSESLENVDAVGGEIRVQQGAGDGASLSLVVSLMKQPVSTAAVVLH